jgi:hypothetical protein
MSLPRWVEPRLSKLSAKAPSGPQWIHEGKFDGYRMAARIEGGRVKLLTRSGLDWTEKYPATEAALRGLKVKTAFIDGELCGVRPDGITLFELMQQASDRGGAGVTRWMWSLSTDSLKLLGMASPRTPEDINPKLVLKTLRRSYRHANTLEACFRPASLHMTIQTPNCCKGSAPPPRNSTPER